MTPRGTIGEYRSTLPRRSGSVSAETAPLIPRRTMRGPYSPQRGSDMDYRMRYYNTLVSKMGAPLGVSEVPEHLVPSELYSVQVDAGDAEVPGDGKQSSLMTIFSIWNTMMGSSLMAMPWGYWKGGLVGGILSCLCVGFISWYTCLLILRMKHSHPDFFELCQSYFGRPGKWISWIISLAFLLGILVSFNIIMTTSLYDAVDGFRLIANHQTHPNPRNRITNEAFSSMTSALPPLHSRQGPERKFSHATSYTSSSLSTSEETPDTTNNPDSSNPDISPSPTPAPPSPEPSSSPILSHRIWNRYFAGGIIALICFGLSNVRNYSFLVKLNTWSIVLLIYLIIFFLGSSLKQQLHGPTATMPPTTQTTHRLAFLIDWHFSWFCGVLTASFVLHNAIINIFQHQRHPEHNVRDLTIGYGLVIVTYLLVGSVCFVAFRNSTLVVEEHGGTIPEDFLQLFPLTNVGAIAGRLALLIHVLSAFPLLATIFRIQFFGMLFQSQFPGWIYMLALNLVLVAVAGAFGIFLPHLALVLRFLGASSGALLIFIIPPVLYWKKIRQEHLATQESMAFILATGSAGATGTGHGVSALNRHSFLTTNGPTSINSNGFDMHDRYQPFPSRTDDDAASSCFCCSSTPSATCLPCMSTSTSSSCSLTLHGILLILFLVIAVAMFVSQFF